MRLLAHRQSAGNEVLRPCNLASALSQHRHWAGRAQNNRGCGGGCRRPSVAPSACTGHQVAPKLHYGMVATLVGCTPKQQDVVKTKKIYFLITAATAATSWRHMLGVAARRFKSVTCTPLHIVCSSVLSPHHAPVVPPTISLRNKCFVHIAGCASPRCFSLRLAPYKRRQGAAVGAGRAPQLHHSATGLAAPGRRHRRCHAVEPAQLRRWGQAAPRTHLGAHPS